MTLDPAVFPDAADVQQDQALGRLKITSTLGDDDHDGEYEQLVHYGTRSFSVWSGSNGDLLYDSGEEFENIIASRVPALFNSQGDAGSFDKRSDDKGPEPEGAVVGRVNGRQYAFIGLERVGGIMIYDVSSPTAARFVHYEPAVPGDVAPEGLAFIDAADSPDHQPLLVVANEVSGTISVYAMPVPPIPPRPVPAAPVWGLGLAALVLAGIGWRIRKRRVI